MKISLLISIVVVLSPFIANAQELETYRISGEGKSKVETVDHYEQFNGYMHNNMLHGNPLNIMTEGATQALEYKLDNLTVIGISNSGRTKELIRLFTALERNGHASLFGITANPDTLLEGFSNASLRLRCGKEIAVAATKRFVDKQSYRNNSTITQLVAFQEIIMIFEIHSSKS